MLSNSPQETLYSPTQNFERTIILLDDFCAECEVFRQTEIFVSQKITNIIFFADFINKFYFSLASNVIILQNKENAGNEKQLTIKGKDTGLILKHDCTEQLQKLPDHFLLAGIRVIDRNDPSGIRDSLHGAVDDFGSQLFRLHT